MNRVALGKLRWQRLVAGCALAAVLTWPAPARAVQPELLAAGSLLLPGLGQAINGDYAEGAAHLGLSLAAAWQLRILTARDDYIPFDERIDAPGHQMRINRTSYAADLYGTVLSDLSYYSAFGAYRAARAAQGNRGYSTPAPGESAQELALAPFQWRYVSRPTTFAPLLVALLVALAPLDERAYVYRPDRSISRDELAAGFALEHEMVAIGEEAFFRGVLNNSLSHAFGERWGLATSAVVFGLSHEGLGNQATPLGATIFGLYTGYLHQHNGYELGENVALHYWWNVITAVGLLRERAAGRPVQLVALRLSF